MSYKITISEAEAEEILIRQKIEKQAKVLKRLNAVMMRAKDHANTEIAETLGVNVNTVTLWMKIYLKDGVKGLCTLKYDRK